MQRAAGVLLEGEDLAIAAVLARIGVAHLRRVNGDAPATAVRVRDELARFAAAEHPAAVVSGPGEPANPDGGAPVGGSPARIGAAAAAARTGLTTQHVRRLCRRGDLIASRGPDRAWQIEEWSVAELAARRKGG